MPERFELYPDIFEKIASMRRAGRKCVLITIISTKGSTPRAVGAKMLVLDDGSIRGTIGGGVREGELLEKAKALLRSGGSGLLSIDYFEGLKGGAESGPVCGGKMDVFMESIEPDTKTVIVGAGHIGFYLQRFLTLLEFHTVVIDERPEYCSEDRFPDSELIIKPFEKALEGVFMNRCDAIVLVGPSHKSDRAMLSQALKTEAGYIGMIGSKNRVRTVFNHLRQEGVSEKQLQRVHSPIGLDIGSESPAEIALSIAAEIVAARKGKSSKLTFLSEST